MQMVQKQSSQERYKPWVMGDQREKGSHLVEGPCEGGDVQDSTWRMMGKILSGGARGVG